MKLNDWIAAEGGASLVARRLSVTPEALHYWVTGKCTPRIATLLKLVSISKGQLTLEGIVRETSRTKRARKVAL